jgi:hypothetical protein
MGTEIIFADRKLKSEYESLAKSAEFGWLHKALSSAFSDIMGNPSAGVPLKKYRIPRSLRSGSVDNLWKYDLPKGWRLLYSLSVDRSRISIMALILEWCDHGSYQKKYSGGK